jgi:hypothetical protein
MRSPSSVTASRAARDCAAGVKLSVYHHPLLAPDGLLPRRLFAQGVNYARKGEGTMVEDGSLYTLPTESKDIQIGTMGK